MSLLSSACSNLLRPEEGWIMVPKYISEPVNVTLFGKGATADVIMNLVMGK